MKRYLNWVLTFSKASAFERTKMKARLLSGIRDFISGNKHRGNELYKFLESNDVDFIGFIPEISYFREKGSGKELEALYVHAFGGPTLIYKLKHAPALIIANPTLRFNDSFLNDVKVNVKDTSRDIIGITD